MEVTGKCHCGRIRYRAQVDPQKVTICHCTDCQVLSGGAYRVSAVIRAEDFELLAGQPKSYIKTAESGAKRVQAFCPECGTPLYAESVERPTTRSLRLGSVDQRAELPPHKQIWCRSALPWTQRVAEIAPQLDGQS